VEPQRFELCFEVKRTMLLWATKKQLMWRFLLQQDGEIAHQHQKVKGCL